MKLTKYEIFIKVLAFGSLSKAAEYFIIRSLPLARLYSPLRLKWESHC
jgi:hypothetical protein